MNPLALALAAAFFASPAFADMDVPVHRVTAYSGNCSGDRYGGGKTASNGDDVTIHNVELAKLNRARDRKSRMQGVSFEGFDHGNFAEAAVPQARANLTGIFNCFFKDAQNYPGVTFKAGDHYGVGSNGLEKYDASHACVRGLNGMSKPATTIVVEGSCGGIRVRDRESIARKRTHSRRT